MSTPGGRDRLRRLAERTSPSPSPIKRSVSTASMRNKAKALLDSSMDGTESEDDEETLQLQLQEIQMRLKLKKAQKKKAQGSESENESRSQPASLSRANSAAAGRAQSRLEGIRERQLQRSKSQTQIDVPVSPVRRVKPIEPQHSPQRVLLGIDKGLTGRDISLKRAPSLRKLDDGNAQDRRLGPFLSRPNSQVSGRASSAATSTQDEERPKTFSERMAAIRAKDLERQEREKRIKAKRNTAFDISQEQLETFKETAVELPEAPRRILDFTREDVLESYEKPSSNMPRTSQTPGLRSAIRDISSTATATISSRSDSRTSADSQPRKKSNASSKVPPNEVSEAEASQFEPFSAAHLSKRIIPHQVLTRTLSGKKTFQIPDLLRTVKAPDFSGPDVEEDVVVLAIIAKKTDPRSHRPNGGKNEKRGKYMMMGLTDLKWELDLALFDTAFEKFWKIPTGTIIAILNPGFMPPPKGKADTGKFSLVLNSDCDTILEIGTARDLGYCKSVKKDGHVCDTWVDKRHTEFCDFHVNLQLQKTRSSRMEINTMNFGKGDYSTARKNNSKDMTGYLEGKKKAAMEKKTFYDRESHSNVFIGKRTTANLLDDPDYDPDHFHRGSSKEERMTRQILAQEKERQLEERLSMEGNGMGSAYMRAKNTSRPGAIRPQPQNDDGPPPPPDAAALGLLGGKAMDISLSPIKRKRVNTLSSTAGRGWGSGLAKDLNRMRDGENLQPVKKKTRFVTEKGIREAGRESIGGEAAKAVLDDLDDDSDLDIVRE
ncbi:primase zinc finger [Glarea lozoyensis ATCC 20868]|uniref:Primase zinc finger n=1 Tax=Glarea lozoyensis (strain ATCC 20868 / MF5171) TaxID=1116229 RepID=S3DR96_GLAL2|nr:primase zinc finger [Glarea lozoyensis ATCC 20868]EPE28993.1 primase zinc finger [Glarea lozoyensis ATCC 20868]